MTSPPALPDLSDVAARAGFDAEMVAARTIAPRTSPTHPG